MSPRRKSAIVQAWEQLDAYLEELIARRRQSLGDDLISELIRAEDPTYPGDRLTHDELVSLAAILLNAGTDTTRNQLAAAVQVLCAHPDQWALLAEHPELAPQAVDELIRHSPIVVSSLRVAIEDVELGGVFIPAGTYVVANTASANRDPAVYDDPERLNITREAPPALMTFGGGCTSASASTWPESNFARRCASSPSAWPMPGSPAPPPGGYRPNCRDPQRFPSNSTRSTKSKQIRRRSHVAASPYIYA